MYISDLHRHHDEGGVSGLGMADAIWNYAFGGGMLSRIENGEDLESMNESLGGEYTAWDEVVVKLRSWVMDVPSCTHDELEDHLDFLLAAWKAEQDTNGGPVQHRARVYDPYPWATPIGLECFILDGDTHWSRPAFRADTYLLSRFDQWQFRTHLAIFLLSVGPICCAKCCQGAWAYHSINGWARGHQEVRFPR
jgi:hypothetical protein